MAATSFNAFWAGPDKFSFISLYHHSNQCLPLSTSRHAALYHHFEEDMHDPPSDLDVGSLSDSVDSPPISATLQDSTDSDASDIIWGDSAESSESAHEQDDADYESQVEYEYENSLYSSHRNDAFSTFKRYTPMAMPSFLPRPTPSVHYNEPQVQPNYFYLQHGVRAQSQQPSLVQSGEVPLTMSSSLPFSSAFSSDSTTSAPLRSSSSSMIVPHATPTSRSKGRGKGAKKHARKREEDDEYRAEEEEAAEIAQTACRVHNCLVCSRELPDSLRVTQPSWAAILRIVFYTLKVNYPHKEFFNLRSHVYDFVDAHWERICIGKVKSEHWKKQLQDTLAHNKKLFVSGAEVYKQKGFWRLDDLTDPWEDKAGNSNYPKYDVASLQAGLSSSTNGLGGVPSLDDEDDEYNPIPSKQRKRAHKRAKVAAQ